MDEQKRKNDSLQYFITRITEGTNDTAQKIEKTKNSQIRTDFKLFVYASTYKYWFCKT